MKFQAFTPINLKKVLPANRDIEKLHQALSVILPKYDIDTVERVSMFIGQCAHESRQFTVMTENLNYSASGLLRTFGKYFNRATAQLYARQPQRIANRVYANRMGNGDESSGDGWKYRGQGFIQLTGRNNHEAFANSIGMSLEQELVYIRTLEGAIEGSCWYWSQRNLNKDSDRVDIVSATKKINGGKNGLADRTNYVRKSLIIFGGDNNEAQPEILRKGDRGEAVYNLQIQLTRLGYRVAADGIFGTGTENAVKQFQSSSGLVPDGVVGPRTRMVLYV